MKRCDDYTDMGGMRDEFLTTHWSMIEDVTLSDDEKNRALISFLIETYWKPVYSYLRRRGYGNEQAKDLTQGFFHDVVLGRKLIARADHSKGSFRSFLLVALNHYANDVRDGQAAQKRIPKNKLVYLDQIDSPDLPDAVTNLGPEESFNYAWISGLLEQAMNDVETTCSRENRTVHWNVFHDRVLQPVMDNTVPPSMKEICDQYGVLLIIDEVICGFGRTGKWFGVEHFGIEPDIITMAKGISSGYVPLGAAGCTDAVMEPIENFMHVNTYSNHPVACAAGLRNIQIMKDENLIENSARMGEYFLECLRLLSSHPIIGEVRGTGLWTAIDFTADKKTRATLPLDRLISLVRRAKSKGLIIKIMGPAIEFAPPLTLQKSEIDEGMKILEECITEEEKDMGL